MPPMQGKTGPACVWRECARVHTEVRQVQEPCADRGDGLQIDLHNGDCLELMKDIPDGSVDCAMIDPPYKIVAGGCRKVALGDECSGILNKRRESNKRTDWVEEVRTGKMFKHNDIKFEY